MSFDDRFSGIIKPEYRNEKIAVIGLGGIGSHTALGLFTTGYHHLILCDHDTVETANLGTQVYHEQHLMQLKTLAMFSMMDSKAEHEDEEDAVSTWDERYHFESMEESVPYSESRIVIAAVDSMEVRKQILLDMIGYNMDGIFIDTRMASDEYQMQAFHCRNERAVERWHWNWFPDSAAVQEPCTTRATYHTGLYAAARVLATVNECMKINAGTPGKLKEYERYIIESTN